jgi:hypothetical protein
MVMSHTILALLNNMLGLISVVEVSSHTILMLLDSGLEIVSIANVTLETNACGLL